MVTDEAGVVARVEMESGRAVVVDGAAATGCCETSLTDSTSGAVSTLEPSTCLWLIVVIDWSEAAAGCCCCCCTGSIDTGAGGAAVVEEVVVVVEVVDVVGTIT